MGMDPAYPSNSLRQNRDHLLCTDDDKDISVYSITRRFLFTVKEIVKDYVTVDIKSVPHNM